MGYSLVSPVLSKGKTQLRYTAAFVDVRLIRAPRAVVSVLLDAFLQKEGLTSDAFESHTADRVLEKTAMNHRGWFSLFVRGQASLLRYSLEAVSANETRVKMQTGFGPCAEWCLYGAMCLLGTVLNLLVSFMISRRSQLISGRDLTYLEAFGLPCVGFAIWCVVFAWVGWQLMECGTLPSKFYRQLTAEKGLQHMAVNLPAATWPQAVSMVITAAAFIFVAVQAALGQHLPPNDRIAVVVIIAMTVGLCLPLFALRHALWRWLMGQASFFAAVSLAFYCLLPPIAANLLLGDARQVFAANESGQPQVLKTTIVAATSLGSLLGGSLLLWVVVHGAPRIARSIDYCRSHWEIQAWVSPRRRIQLGCFAVPFYLFGGLVVSLVFFCSTVFLLHTLLADRFRLTSPIFEDASCFINLMVRILSSWMGFAHFPSWPGRMALVLYSSPVLLWGVDQLKSFAAELYSYLRLLRQEPTSSMREFEDASADVAAVATFARLRPPLVRIGRSKGIHAYVVIPALPFLSRVIVLSEGTLGSVPGRCRRALVAHEIGHIKHAHTTAYTTLRLLSRLLLLGPSALTGIIKPATVLESEADAFAVRWLEATGGSRQDLIDAIKRTEEQRVVDLLQNHNLGVARWGMGDWLPPALRARLEGDKPQSPFGRLATGWKLLYYMAMNSDLATYTYTPLSERLRRIETLSTAGRISS